MSSIKLPADKNTRHIVTSGARYLDIDSYGGIIGYSELLTRQGFQAIAIGTPPLNESITPTIRSWGMPLEYDYHSRSDDRFTIVDVQYRNSGAGKPAIRDQF